MKKLQDLIDMTPDEVWSLNESGHLVNPSGQVLEVNSDDPVQEKLYAEFLLTALNRIRILLWDINFERKRVDGLFKELKHTQGRVRESYSRGVEAAASTLHDITVNTPTARDALIAASESMERLLEDDN